MVHMNKALVIHTQVSTQLEEAAGQFCKQNMGPDAIFEGLSWLGLPPPTDTSDCLEALPPAGGMRSGSEGPLAVGRVQRQHPKFVANGHSQQGQRTLNFTAGQPPLSPAFGGLVVAQQTRVALQAGSSPWVLCLTPLLYSDRKNNEVVPPYRQNLNSLGTFVRKNTNQTLYSLYVQC